MPNTDMAPPITVVSRFLKVGLAVKTIHVKTN